MIFLSLSNTPLAQFLDQVDAKTAIWYELANRPTYQTSGQQHHAIKSIKKIRFAQAPPQRIPTNDEKSHTYLVDINQDDGYGIYEEEDDREERM